MAIYLSNRDGGKTDEQGHYKFQTNAFTGNVLDGGLLVTQNSPLAMNVKVSGGDARIPYSDYAYTAWIPAGAPETVTVTTANPSNPRIDRLVMYVDRGATPSSATANNPTLCKLMLVAGTPAGSPSRPSNGTVNTAVSNNPYIDLADIRVNAGVTQITNANITDTRVLVGAPIADGSVTPIKQSNPYYFRAYSISQNFTAGVYKSVIYQNVVADPNSDYDSSTGEYTAPVTGLYQLHASCYWASSNQKVGTFAINGVNDNTTGTTAMEVTTMGLCRVTDQIQLTAGDKVTAWFRNAATETILADYRGSNFSGHLITQTA